MGRRKSVRELQKQLQYAQARAAYTPPDPDPSGAIRKRSRTPVRYGSSTVANTNYTVQVSTNALQFFGGLAALGLADAEDHPNMRSNDSPAQIHATVADTSPTRLRAQGSNRPYIRYAQGTRGSGVQSSYTSAISGDTPLALRNRFQTAADSVKARLGGEYGRVWMEPERILFVESGGT